MREAGLKPVATNAGRTETEKEVNLNTDSRTKDLEKVIFRIGL